MKGRNPTPCTTPQTSTPRRVMVVSRSRIGWASLLTNAPHVGHKNSLSVPYDPWHLMIRERFRLRPFGEAARTTIMELLTLGSGGIFQRDPFQAFAPGLVRCLHFQPGIARNGSCSGPAGRPGYRHSRH